MQFSSPAKNDLDCRDALFWRAILAEGFATAAFTYFLVSVRKRAYSGGLLGVLIGL